MRPPVQTVLSPTMHTKLPAPPKGLVIVVDDDTGVLTSLELFFEVDGYAVRTYSEPDKLLAELDFPSHGCLVTDYHLPGTNGLALIAELRKRGVTIPAILITGASNPALAARAAACGVPIVEKPSLGNKLNEAVHAALTRALSSA